MNLVDFARELIDIDSTTGREQAAGAWPYFLIGKKG